MAARRPDPPAVHAASWLLPPPPWFSSSLRLTDQSRLLAATTTLGGEAPSDSCVEFRVRSLVSLDLKAFLFSPFILLMQCLCCFPSAVGEMMGYSMAPPPVGSLQGPAAGCPAAFLSARKPRSASFVHFQRNHPLQQHGDVFPSLAWSACGDRWGRRLKAQVHYLLVSNKKPLNRLSTLLAMLH